MTPQEWLNKAEWEGGLIEAVGSYGLTSDYLDDSAPDGFKEAIDTLSHHCMQANLAARAIEEWAEEEGWEYGE